MLLKTIPPVTLLLPMRLKNKFRELNCRILIFRTSVRSSISQCHKQLSRADKKTKHEN